MFLCEPCHVVPCHATRSGPWSRGPCESCGRVRDCSSCSCNTLATRRIAAGCTLRVVYADGTQVPAVVRADGQDLVVEWTLPKDGRVVAFVNERARPLVLSGPGTALNLQKPVRRGDSIRLRFTEQRRD